jgi:hypothetical protein
MGFVIMGAIGYFIKLSMPAGFEGAAQDANTDIVHIPVNNVLVG